MGTVLTFKTFADRGKTTTKISTLDMGKADFREFFSKVARQAVTEDIRVHQCWLLFKDHFGRAQEWAIPKCQESCKGDILLAWLNGNLPDLWWKRNMYGIGSEVR